MNYLHWKIEIWCSQCAKSNCENKKLFWWYFFDSISAVNDCFRERINWMFSSVFFLLKIFWVERSGNKRESGKEKIGRTRFVERLLWRQPGLSSGWVEGQRAPLRLLWVILEEYTLACFDRISQLGLWSVTSYFTTKLEWTDGVRLVFWGKFWFSSSAIQTARSRTQLKFAQPGQDDSSVRF